MDLPFPLALKPAIKENDNALTVAKAWRVEGDDELARLYGQARQIVDPDVLMVQELIPGGGESQLSYAALCQDGIPQAELTARRTRQYPAEFGRASTFVETVRCPEAVELSRRLLAELGYTGLIEIEFKRDPRDGILKLLDMNPRVWGWHTLCARAGVDFPWLLWLLVCGREVPSTVPRPGVGWLRFSTDAPTAIRELLGGRLALREYLRSLHRPRESAIFAWDDPVPGLIELPLLAYTLTRRMVHREAV
jgi:predicted ATP-grasp superfamily ATP-dependent carboligase